jgi:hypothetical protein
MKFDLRRPLLLVLLFLGLGSCQSEDRPVRPGDAEYPEPNPNPTHVVRVSGTIAPTLDVKFSAHYESDSLDKGCWQNAPLWKGGGEKYMGEWLELKRGADRYSTSFVVDKFLPGRCDWRLIGISAVVARKDDPNDASGDVVIEGRRFDQSDTAPQCPSWTLPTCKEDRARRLTNPNDEIPVEMRCRMMLPSETINGKGGFSCQDLWDDGYKKRHLLKPHTRSVRIDIIEGGTPQAEYLKKRAGEMATKESTP